MALGSSADLKSQDAARDPAYIGFRIVKVVTTAPGKEEPYT
jgi:hypothetical protein